MATNEPTTSERVDQLNQAFGAKPGGVPSFRAEHEGDDYLFGRRPKKTPVTVTILARVGDSEVLNEIATLEPEVTMEPIDDENRQPGDAREATVRVEFDLAGALRAAADEIDRDLGNVRPAPDVDEQLLEQMRIAYVDAWEAENARIGRGIAPAGQRSRAGMRAAVLELQKAGR